jgi:hypothetical protein
MNVGLTSRQPELDAAAHELDYGNDVRSPTFQQARPGPWAKVGHESQLAKYLMSVDDD